MRETKFIEQNKEKWAEYESMIQNGSGEPEKLNDLFVQITDDLSYARTFYPNRSVKVYLNHLAQRIFNHIYKGRKFPKERLVQFWTNELPQVMWESRFALRLSLGIFVLSFVIGVVSSILNPDFAKVVLGESYVQMTLQNIESGDPMAVYKDHQPLGSFVGIAANNLWVAFLTAVAGVIASIGTVFLLISNGIMVGAFQFFFIEKGLFWPSFLTIWIHGTLEISAIIIAGGAGLIAGSGLLFPGTFTRTQAFQISMRRGMKIFVGIVPVIIIAAFFEGFLTRFTEVPDVLRGLFIVTSLAFVLGYYVVLPRLMANRGRFSDFGKDADLPPDGINPVRFTTIKTTGEIISDSFVIVKKNLQWTFTAVFTSAFAFTVYTLFQSSPPADFVHLDDIVGRTLTVAGLSSYIGTDYTQWTRWVALGLFLLVTFVGFRMTEQEMPQVNKPTILNKILQGLALVLPIMLMFWIMGLELPIWWAFFLRIILPFVVMPIVLSVYWIAAIRYGSSNPFVGLWTGLQSLRYLTGYLVCLLVIGLMALLLLFMKSEFWSMFLKFFSWAVPPGEKNVAKFATTITTFTTCIILYFTWLMLVISGILQFFSHREITEATHLHQQIETVGTLRQIRGIPKE
jgi:uncharacterized membrane protein SpoIIM required for sporulation